MATVKKGTLTRAKEWWKHLRVYKRHFWRAERKAVRRDIRNQCQPQRADCRVD